jgi:hypothetical protein
MMRSQSSVAGVRIDAVVQTVQKVTKDSLNLGYLPRDRKVAPTGNDIRIKHLRDKGRSSTDRLKHGLASLSLAEQCKDWRCVWYLLMQGNCIDVRIPVL